MGRGAGEGQAAEPRATRNALEATRAGVAAFAAKHGFEAYEVGGSIRDELLGRDPKDLDVMVRGFSGEELLRAAREEGRAEELVVAERLIGVRLDAPWTELGAVEFALARREVSTGPAHTDFEIIADPSVPVEEDLARRDFTANAIARRLGGGGELIDPYGGVKDVEEGRLRLVYPRAFHEDPLRVWRGLARIARDRSRPDAETLAAMTEAAPSLSPTVDGALSGERVFEQIEKLFGGEDAGEAMRIARDSGVWAAALPELAPMLGFEQQSKYHSLTVDEHSIRALENAVAMNAPQEVRWAAFLHDSGKPASAFLGKDGRLHYYSNDDDPDQRAHETVGAEISSDLLNRLRAPRELEQEVSALVEEHMFGDGFSQPASRRRSYKVRKFINRVGRDRAANLLLLRRADHAAKGELSADWDRDIIEFEEEVWKQWDAPLTRSELAVNGNDLLSIGLEGPQIGKTFAELSQRILAEPEMNNRERLISWAKKLNGIAEDDPSVADQPA